jgi:hypothetical protein
LVWGKFLPLHAGHSLVIHAALAACDRVTVVVGARHDEPIPRDVRAAWVRELHPDVEVRLHWDDWPTDYGDPSVWDLHMQELVPVLPAKLDAVFTSETYGDELGRRLGPDARVGRSRSTHPAVLRRGDTPGT